ncbi:MAG: discoidin domain-containing protein [Armatimonadetes bacterium]|nr:discoidin domain-containing protein [Armatimonadota bacterium]
MKLLLLLCVLFCATSHGAPVKLGDKALSVVLNDDSRLSSLNVGGRELLSTGQTAGLSVYDVGERKGPFPLKGRVERTQAGATLSYDCPELGLGVACEVRAGQRHTLALNIAVDDQRKVDRGITLEFAVPLGTTGWTWWDDPDGARPVEPGKQYASLARLRELPGLPEFDNAANVSDFGSYSWYPVAAVTGKSGIGLAKPPRAAGLFRFGFDGSRGVFYCAFDFALSQDAKKPGHADLSLVLFPVDAAHGFRGALAELYELWPEDFRSRVPDFGGWMPFQRLSLIPNVDEFGFGYQEGAPEPPIEDTLGVSSFTYFHCAGEFANIPGYQRGQPLPPYEQQLAAVNQSVKLHTGLENIWNITGIQLPDGRINLRPESTYGHLFAQGCVHPDLPYGKFMADNLVKRVTENKTPTGIDGCYYDGIAVGLDYSREHFKITKHPLLWDARLKRPVAYNFFSSLEWAEKIAEAIHPQQKLTMLNDSSMSSFSFSFPYIDVLGAEGGWINSDAECHRARAYCYHKPFCTLLKTDYRQHPPEKIESYMRSLVAFGHLPGFFDISPSGANAGSSYWEHPEWFDRDRGLFRRYMPLCAELGRAGWEPVLYAATSTSNSGELAEFESSPGAKLERFGGGREGTTSDLVYYTIRRSTDAEGGPDVSLQVSKEVRCASGPNAVAVDLLTGQASKLTGGKVSVNVPPGEISVIAVGTKAAQIHRCLDRATRLIEARQRYVKTLISPSGLGAWGGYMEGGENDTQVAHSGHACLRATLANAGKSAGANQSIGLNQTKPEDLIVKAFSKSRDVSGGKDAGYSIYVDCYYHNGEKLYGNTIQFEPGTHDWQGGEIHIHPTATIAQIQFYCMFRGHTGTVWFDDVSLATASEPEKNLLQNGGFERGVAPLEDPFAIEAGKTLDVILAMIAPLKTARPLNPTAIGRLGQTAAIVLSNMGDNKLSPDAERAARDLRDVRELLDLAHCIGVGKPRDELQPQRLTPAFPLEQPKPKQVVQPQAAAVTARVPAGTKVTVDSSYEGYNPTPLTDGRINPKTDDWASVAWASEEGATEHWIQLDFPAVQRISGVVIHWAFDSGSYYDSQKVLLEVKQGAIWSPVNVSEINRDNSGAKTALRFAALETRCLRIRQPVGGGPTGRPDILWVSEVEVY